MRNDELIALAERCEKAIVPDREIDLAAHNLLIVKPGGHPVRWANLGLSEKPQTEFAIMALPEEWSSSKKLHFVMHNQEYAMFRLPSYTSSLDAVVALIEEKLPGWRIAEVRQLVEKRGGNWKPAGLDCFLSEMNGRGEAEGEGATAAIALLSATLRALAAQQEGRDHG